jgi:hypothetical protein
VLKLDCDYRPRAVTVLTCRSLHRARIRQGPYAATGQLIVACEAGLAQESSS